ncbi:hypothetical protein TcBrA4_0131680 [Trypanosoma cruzi]|nr:hypothetical protein TcBrA4_0131680 [Trypanosoma cruzi]
MMQRLATARFLPVSTSLYFSRRAVSDEEGGEKKRKVNLDDDDRWLEAEFDEKIRTPEERYAFQRQRELMKSIINKMRNEHDEKLGAAVAKHNEKIDAIKAQMASLEEKLKEISKED